MRYGGLRLAKLPSYFRRWPPLQTPEGDKFDGHSRCMARPETSKRRLNDRINLSTEYSANNAMYSYDKTLYEIEARKLPQRPRESKSAHSGEETTILISLVLLILHRHNHQQRHIFIFNFSYDHSLYFTCFRLNSSRDCSLKNAWQQ